MRSFLITLLISKEKGALIQITWKMPNCFFTRVVGCLLQTCFGLKYLSSRLQSLV